MIEEQYVTFETAKLLRKNGFAVKCHSYYLKDGNRFEHCAQEVLPRGEAVYACPTQAVAMRWLREAYNIAVTPIPFRYPGVWQNILVFLGEPMEKDDKYDICQLRKKHTSYEEAAEAGIQYVVKDVVANVRKELAKQAKAETLSLNKNDHK